MSPFQIIRTQLREVMCWNIRVAMEDHLGRFLTNNEVVHHKDHNKKNNAIENLEVMDRSVHGRLHGTRVGQLWAILKCPWCGKQFERPNNRIFTNKNSKYFCTCCSNTCRGKLSSTIQHHGLSRELEQAISENILTIYRKYKDVDNFEEDQ